MKSKFEKLSKDELVATLEVLFEIIKSKREMPKVDMYSIRNSKKFLIEYRSPAKNKVLKTLIGTIPFLLMDEMIFERNSDIANFANTLNITIPSPEKKKKEDIIGRIIVSISKFDENRIYELNQMINRLTENRQYTNKSNFFADWDRAIKSIKL